MTAFADTILFMTIVMIAVSVTAVTSLTEDYENIPPDRFLNMVSEIEVRLSDMTDIEDDVLILLPDAMAYSIEHETSVSGYLASLLDAVYGPGRYCMSYTFGEGTVTIGEPREYFRSSASEEAAVSVGGHVSMKLKLYA